MDFTVPADHRGKIKESKKTNKILELYQKTKRNQKPVKVTVIPIVVVALGMTPQRLGKKTLEELEIKEKIETVQTTP